MKIHLLRSRDSKQQLDEMLEALGVYVKLAVDIQRDILAGGGALHADCEVVLLADGSQQEDIWGADWIPSTQQMRYETLINIRPRQNNLALEILDSSIREHIAEIGQCLRGGRMKDQASLRERYRRDELSIWLGGLAANLARISSFSDHPRRRIGSPNRAG